MHQTQSTITLKVSLPNEQAKQLDNLAEITNQSTAELAAEAISCYLQVNARELDIIRDAVEYANSGKAKFAAHDDVCKWLDSWGSDHPLPLPQCK